MVDNAPSLGIVRYSKNPVDARGKNIQQRAKSLSLAGAEREKRASDFHSYLSMRQLINQLQIMSQGPLHNGTAGQSQVPPQNGTPGQSQGPQVGHLPAYGSPVAAVNLSHRPESEEDGSPNRGGGRNLGGPGRNVSPEEVKVRVG